MSAQGVALVVKAAAVAAGYPPEMFSGHSLRAGFLTEAGRQNANLFKMKEHSRHSSLEMVAEYERFREHAGEGFFELKPRTDASLSALEDSGCRRATSQCILLHSEPIDVQRRVVVVSKGHENSEERR